MPEDNTSPPEAAGEALLPHHVEQLKASGLSAKTVAIAQLHSLIDPIEVGAKLGWGRSGPAPGIGFPIFGPRGTQVSWSYRPDQPLVRENGTTRKYENMKGQKARLYFSPTIAATDWVDRSKLLVLTEGIKKALCVAQLGIPAIAALGVYGFHDNDAKARDGSWRLNADLEGVPLQGRVVLIAFDAPDTTENPNVILAEARLGRMLLDAGADVRLIRLPVEAP